MTEKIEELIEESKVHTFEKNCYSSNNGTYSRPSVDFQAWIAESEDYILSNYGKESSPWRIFARFQRKRLDGNYWDTFELEKEIIISALTSCLRIPVKTVNKSLTENKNLDFGKVFIVHGHDALLKIEVARFIEKLKI